MRPTALLVATFLIVSAFAASAQQDASAPQDASPSGQPATPEREDRGARDDVPQPTPAPKARLDILPGDPRPEIRIESTGQPMTAEEADEVRRQFRDLAGIMYQGLDSNPEIMAARAELEAAQARLRQLEMRTATDIVRKQQEIQDLETRLDAKRRLVDREFAAPNELVPLEVELSGKKAEYEYLIGRPGSIAKGEKLMRLDAPQAVVVGADEVKLLQIMGEGESRPSLEEGAPEHIRRVLGNPIQILFEQTPLHEIMDFIVNQYEINLNADLKVRDVVIDVNLKSVTLSQAFSALADAYGLVFIVRDYGVFITDRQNAETIPGPSIPEGVRYYKNAGHRARFRSIAPPAPPKSMEPFKYDAERFPLDQVELRREEVRIVPPSGDTTPRNEDPQQP